MSRKKVKVKGIKVFLSVQEVKALEDLLIKSAMFKGGFSKLKKIEIGLWHLFNDVCEDLKLKDNKIKKPRLDKSLH